MPQSLVAEVVLLVQHLVQQGELEGAVEVLATAVMLEETAAVDAYFFTTNI